MEKNNKIDLFEMFLRDNGGKLVYDEFMDETGFRFEGEKRFYPDYYFLYVNTGESLLIYYIKEWPPKTSKKDKTLTYWGNVPKTMQAMEILFFDLFEIRKRRKRLLIEKIEK